MRKLRYFLAGLALLGNLLMLAPAASATDVLNVCSNGGSASAVCTSKTSTNPVAGSNSLLLKITRIVAIIAGAVAVIIIIISGMRYVLSSGDSAKTSAARSAIIYALIGLVVIILAQSIVSFVIGRFLK